MRSRLNDVRQDYTGFRKRLIKLLGKERTVIVRALAADTVRYKDGVEGHRLRRRFKRQLDQLHSLTGRFIREDFEDDGRRVYRPRLLALIVADTERSREQLWTIDRIVRFLETEHDQKGARQIRASEVAATTTIPQQEVYEGLCYIREMGIGGGSSSAIPDRPDWYFIPGDGLFELPDLDSVLEQQVTQAEDDVKHGKRYAAMLSGHSDWIGFWRNRISAWIGRHKMLSLAYVILGATVSIPYTRELLARIVGWITR